MIGHASSDERGSLKNGKAGDQTGREVYIRDWYSRPWNVVLVCKDDCMREKIAEAMQAACENNLIGYDQNQRNTLLTYSRPVGYNPALVKMDCECDCSSLVSICCMYAGIPENVLYKCGNCCTTSTLRKALMGTGLFEEHTECKYTNSEDYLLRGSILLYEGHHVAVSLTDGKCAMQSPTPKVYTPTTNKIDMVDLSHHNTVTNWSKLAAECKNVCIRMGYISYQSGALTTDKKFVENIKNATAQGIPVGVYVWDQSINTTEAVTLADYCIKAIKPYKISLPVFIDSEYYNSARQGRADKLSAAQRTKNIIAFCERIKAAGYAVGVYASDSWFKTNLEFDKIKNYTIWCARYSTSKPTISKYDIWQYGSKNFSWATGAIDVNNIYSLSSQTPPSNENYISLQFLGRITASALNLRDSDSTEGNIIRTLKKGEIVSVVAQTPNNWYKLSTGEYASAKYIEILNGTVVNCSSLNVRSTPNSSNSSNIIKAIPQKTKMILMDKQDGWYQILLNDNTIGWCSAKYIKEG